MAEYGSSTQGHNLGDVMPGHKPTTDAVTIHRASSDATESHVCDRVAGYVVTRIKVDIIGCQGRGTPMITATVLSSEAVLVGS